MNFLYRLSFRKRILYSFILLIVLAVSATGFMTYLIARDIVIDNVAEQTQDTVNKTAQALDEKLRKMTIAILSMMMSEQYKDVVRDVRLQETDSYYLHLSAIQSVLAQ